MADRTAKLRLGGFVAASLVALAGLTVLFGGTPTVFSNKARYTLVFPEAPGITVGTPVRKSGVRVGEVVGLDLDEATGQARVHVQVDKRYLPRQTEEPLINRGLLSGDTAIDFTPKAGTDGQPISVRGDPFPADTEIVGVAPVNPGRLVQQASGVLPTAQESLLRIGASIQRVEQAVPRVERAFDEITALARSGREFIGEARSTNDRLKDLLTASAVQPDDPTQPQVGLRSTLAEIRDFVRAARPLVDDIRTLVRANEQDITGAVRGIRRTAEGLADVLSENNRKSIAATLTNLEAASDDLTKAIRLAAVVLDQGEKTLKTFNARLNQAEGLITNAQGAFRNAETAFGNINNAVRPFADGSAGVGGVMGNVNTAADQLAKALVEVRATLQAVNRSDGTLQKVLTDPTLYNTLNDAAANLNRTLARAEKIARDLEVFADKIARRPETLGVGGAVRPSAGLKESPSAPLGQPAVPPLPPSHQPPAGQAIPPVSTFRPPTQPPQPQR